jgi:hypothetical protein
MERGTISARLAAVRQHLRWGALLGVVLLCVGLVYLSVRVRQEAPLPSDRNTAMVTLHDFRTEVYEHGIRVRVSGSLVRMSPAKLAGPFRLGFAQALVGHNITLELFPQDTPLRPDRRPASVQQLLSSLAPSLSRLVLARVPGQSGITLAQAECGPLTILSHDGAETLVLFSAERCWTNLGFTKIQCTEGTVRRGESTLAFRELTYTRQHWKLLTTDGQSQQVDELLNFG